MVIFLINTGGYTKKEKKIKEAVLRWKLSLLY